MYSCPITLHDSLFINISRRSINVLYFLHSDSNQGKIVCKIASELL